MTPDELRALPLFAGVSDAGLERLAARAAELERDPGQVVALPGDPGSGMFVICDGTVSVELRGDAPIELKAGTFFGELALLNPEATRIGSCAGRDEGAAPQHPAQRRARIGRVGAERRAHHAEGDRTPVRRRPAASRSPLANGRHEADRREPARAAGLRVPRATRGRCRPERHRGKSARDGHVQLGSAYADIRDGEAWLVGASIAEYAQKGSSGHDPDRERKLLLHRREIDSLYGKVREKGLTLVPVRMYFKDGRVKVELALAAGRERADKRRVIAERDAQRQMERALKRRR